MQRRDEVVLDEKGETCDLLVLALQKLDVLVELDYALKIGL